jgi:hypothetical protein
MSSTIERTVLGTPPDALGHDGDQAPGELRNAMEFL